MTEDSRELEQTILKCALRKQYEPCTPHQRAMLVGPFYFPWGRNTNATHPLMLIRVLDDEGNDTGQEVLASRDSLEPEAQTVYDNELRRVYTQIRDHYSCEAHKLTEVCIGALSRIRGDSEEVWLVARRRDTGQWEFPGGKREKGETHMEAVRREYFEETGLTVMTNSLASKAHFVDREGKPYLTYTFLCSDRHLSEHPEDPALSDSHTELAWLGFDEIHDLYPVVLSLDHWRRSELRRRIGLGIRSLERENRGVKHDTGA